MRRDEVMAILTAHQDEIRAFGVRSLSLFGSVARDEAGPESDIDLLVEFDRPVGYFTLLDLQEYLEDLLGVRVDLGTPGSLKDALRDTAIKEAIRVA